MPPAECHSALRRAFSEPQTAPRDERRRGRPAFVLFYAQFGAAGLTPNTAGLTSGKRNAAVA